MQRLIARKKCSHGSAFVEHRVDNLAPAGRRLPPRAQQKGPQPPRLLERKPRAAASESHRDTDAQNKKKLISALTAASF
jgi:hypothetical protein